MPLKLLPIFFRVPITASPRADSLRAIESVSHHLSDLIRCEQIHDFLQEKPLGPDAFNTLCTFLGENQFTLDEAMDIAQAIQTQDSTFLITARLDDSDIAMLHDHVAVIDALVQRDMVFTLWAFEDAPAERLMAVEDLFDELMGADIPRYPQVTGLIVAEGEGDPSEDQLTAWRDLTATVMELETLHTLECGADWVETFDAHKPGPQPFDFGVLSRAA